MTLRIHLLGDFSLTYNGAPCTALHRARLQSLLAYLLLHRQAPQLRQHLAFQLWPDSTERQARNNLRKALHQLRQRLPDADSFLQVDAHTVQWRSDAAYTLDVAEFETKLRQGTALSDDPQAQQALWEEAVALYGGDLLPACYDEWILPERERLRQAFIETLEELVWLAEEQRQYGAAIRHANHLLRYDPLHEATYRRLMRLHAVCGDRASSLQVYHTCVTVLRRELDVEPGPEIQRAYARLLEMEVPTRLRTHSASPTQATERLVGREDAWQTLQAAWQRAVQGDVHFCLIQGEAGIGKTRLAEELLTWVERQGMATARTRSYAAAGGLVYTPVIEWLRSEAIYPVLEALDAVWLSEVARLLPELLAEHPHLPQPKPWASGGPGAWQRQRLFEALARAVLAAPQPKLLLIDDLQWCDGETLAWLHYLLNIPRDTRFAQQPMPRLLIVGTVRPEEVDAEHPLTALCLELTRRKEITEIDLRSLDAAQTAHLAAQVAQTELNADAIIALHHYTGGNPLFVVETVHTHDWREMVEHAGVDDQNPLPQAHASRLPAKVQSVIQSRLTQLSSAAQELASLAAVTGRSFTFDLLWRASDNSERKVMQSLEELWQRRVVRAQGIQTYDFSHDRIREAAYAAISPVQRPQLHRQVAGALEQIHAADLDPISAQLAAHYEQAGEVAKAIDYYQQAAAVAHARFADADAVVFLHRALTLMKDLPTTRANQERELSILLQLAQPLVVAQGFLEPELGEIGTRASELAQELGKQRAFFHALSSLRSFHQMRGHYPEAYGLATQMLSLAEGMLDEAVSSTADGVQLLATAHHGLGNVLFFTGELLEAQSHFDQALSLEHPTVGLLVFSAMNLWLLGYPNRARHQMHRSLVVAQRLGHPHQVGFAMTNLARLNYFLRRMRLTKLWAQEAIALCLPYDIPFWINLSKLFLGRAWAEAGETERGIAQLRSTLDRLDKDGHQAFCSHFWSLLAEAYTCASQFSDALTALDRALSFVERNGEGFWHPELVRLCAEYRLTQGAPIEEVEKEYQQAIAIARQQCAKSLELRATVSLARLWQQQDRSAEAYALLANIYGWFTEGFNTPDLQEARTLLAALS